MLTYIFKPKLDVKLGLSYGAYLAFSENAIFVGVLVLPNYLLLNVPFIPLLLAVHVMDRVSSFILHLFWGFSASISFINKDIKYLLISMPYGMVDALTAYFDLTHAIYTVLDYILNRVTNLFTHTYLRKRKNHWLISSFFLISLYCELKQ